MAAAPFRRSVILAALALAGCSEGPRDAPISSGNAASAAAGPDTPVSSGPGPASAGSPTTSALPADCNASKAGRFVGRQDAPATRSELAAAVAPITAIRWVGPGDATTEDYSVQRLNVMLDAGGTIRSVHCG